jgi:hypothetical protein
LRHLIYCSTKIDYFSVGELQKGCIRLAATSHKIYQLLANGRWFSSGTPASSNTKTGRHDIAEILRLGSIDGINEYEHYLPLNV